MIGLKRGVILLLRNQTLQILLSFLGNKSFNFFEIHINKTKFLSLVQIRNFSALRRIFFMYFHFIMRRLRNRCLLENLKAITVIVFFFILFKDLSCLHLAWRLATVVHFTLILTMIFFWLEMLSIRFRDLILLL
jgi:hypothetical protein